MMKERIFSGAQPSADSLHIGNYFGAIRQWAAMQDVYDAIYCIADQHAITVGYDPKTLAERTRLTAAQYIAAGIDPQCSTVFVQSHVPEHMQLAWILICITGMGEAFRMTQYKDKSQKTGSDHASVGLFTYPILQAADILLYNACKVPVGEDQRQHVELARDLGRRFNRRFGDMFNIPETYILDSREKVYDLQNPAVKMSKSSTSPLGTLNILDDDKTISKKIKSAVTDTEGAIAFDPDAKPGVSNLLELYSYLTGDTVEKLVQEYTGKMYGQLKSDIADVAVEYFRPIRDRAVELAEERDFLEEALRQGALRARDIAGRTIKEVYEKVGFLAP